jgi:hypothetical protein
MEWSQVEARRQFMLLATVDPGTIRIVRRLHATEDAKLSVEWCMARTDDTAARLGVRYSSYAQLARLSSTPERRKPRASSWHKEVK